MNKSLLMPFGSCEYMELLFKIIFWALELCLWNKTQLGDTTMEHDISWANLIKVLVTRIQDVLTEENCKLESYAHLPITLLPTFSQVRSSWPKKGQKVKQDSNQNGVLGLRGLLVMCVASPIHIHGAGVGVCFWSGCRLESYCLAVWHDLYCSLIW